MGDYVALMLPEKMGGGIYGVAKCETLEDHRLMLEWAERNNVPAITGELASPEKLLHDAAISYPRRLSHGLRPKLLSQRELKDALAAGDMEAIKAHNAARRSQQ